MYWLLLPPPSALDQYFWVKGDRQNEVTTSTRLKQSPPPPTKAGEQLWSEKTRGRSHNLEPPQIGAAREAGGGRAARRPEDPGPRPLWRPERTGRAGRPAPAPPKSALSAGSHDPGASRPAAATPATSTLVPTSGARAPGPGNTARHSARAHAWPSPGRCGRSRWAQGSWGARSRCHPRPPPAPGPRPRPRPAPGAVPATVPWRDDHEPRRRRRRENWAAAGSRWGKGGPASVPAHCGRRLAPSGRRPGPVERTAWVQAGLCAKELSHLPPYSRRSCFSRAKNRYLALGNLRATF